MLPTQKQKPNKIEANASNNKTSTNNKGVVQFEVGGKVSHAHQIQPQKLSASSGGSSAASSLSGLTLDQSLTNDDPSIRGETFLGHWSQMREIAALQATVPSPDDMVAVLNLLSQMTSLLQMELEAERNSNSLHFLNENRDNPLESIREPNSMPCLDVLLSDNILSHVLATSRMPIDPRSADQLRQQQLLLYETLLGCRQAPILLQHQPFLKPLLELLNNFIDPTLEKDQLMIIRRNGSEEKIKVSTDTELHLVLVLNQLCKRLMENLDLLQFFFMASEVQQNTMNNNNINEETPPSTNTNESQRQFLIFSILVKFLHRDGHVGQLARDALLHCMSLSKKNEEIGNYIAKHSNFCPVLATGLSGLYSLLPRHLPDFLDKDPTFHRFNDGDISTQTTPELSAFLASLQFCDAVVTVAHSRVKEHLLGLVYMGFLVPVLGPALTQSSESELVCTTSYLELFLRRINEPSLLAVFLRFIFVESIDNRNISDVLTIRISSQTKLCQVTLSLFETLLELDCEDIMLWLVFRHLIPLKHILPSKQSSIRLPDIHGRSAEKLLSLIPICCQHATETFTDSSLTNSFSQILRRNSSSSQESSLQSTTQNFNLYLADAKKLVRKSYEASCCWQYPYDGITPPINALHSKTDNKNNISKSTITENSNGKDHCDKTNTNGDSNLGPQYSSSSMSGPASLCNEEDREFWNLMKDSNISDVKLNKVMQKMQMQDNLSTATSSSQGNVSQIGSDSTENTNETNQNPPTVDEVDYTVTSLGCFLDLLFEKIELMASNSLTTNLLVTSIISRLAAQPQPILRSVLLLPEIEFQPSVRGLFTAIGSLRQKLDNIMPTLWGADEAIILSRKFLQERIDNRKNASKMSKTESAIAVASSTISHIGQEATKHKSSISAAFSSMFRKKSSNQVSYSSSSSINSPQLSLNSNNRNRNSSHQHLNREVRMQAMAAVLLEEWLLELSAIAQEHSVLQKEQALSGGIVGAKLSSEDISTIKN